MAKYIPPGFNASRILEGIHRAMTFGEPSRAEDKATFYVVANSLSDTVPHDGEGVPFDPSSTQAQTVQVVRDVPCAIEYHDLTERIDTPGFMSPSRLEITLMDPEYQRVRGFRYVVVGGDRYFYSKTEPPVALGSIDVWTVWVTAEEER